MQNLPTKIQKAKTNTEANKDFILWRDCTSWQVKNPESRALRLSVELISGQQETEIYWLQVGLVYHIR